MAKIKKESMLKSMSLTEIEMGVPLGKGDNGTVYKAYYKDIPLALKVIDTDGRSVILKTTEIIQVSIKYALRSVIYGFW